MHLLDVLLPLKKLSLFLQQEHSVAADVYSLMQDTLTELEHYKELEHKRIYSDKVLIGYFEGVSHAASRTGPMNVQSLHVLILLTGRS